MGLAVEDRGDITVDLRESEGPGMRNFEPLLKAVSGLKSAVGASLADGALPVVLGGEHTLSTGSVGAALDHFGEDLAVLWIDAHADVNTPGSSTSGNIHGMPIAALWGMPSETEGDADRQWERLETAIGRTRLRSEATAWYGLRDLDPAEIPRLKGTGVTMHEIDRFGVEATVRRIADWHRQLGSPPMWVSFDVDALDPILAPGTGTAVRGGLTYREAHLAAELIHEMVGQNIVGVDLVETNPLADSRNETATMAVEWIASLFGKTILGGRG